MTGVQTCALPILHGSSSYRVPWAYDDEAVEVLRYFAKLKVSLLPYLYTAAVHASQTGIPLMRSMVLEFPDDPACGYLDKQYMLGSSLLVAPVFREDGVVEYYLPKGTWTHYLTGEKAEGGRWYQQKYDYLSLPLFVRENTVLPVSTGVTAAAQPYADSLLLKVYELSEESSTEVYQGQEKVLSAVLQPNGDEVKVRLQTGTGCQLQFINAEAESVSGAECKDGETGSVVVLTDAQAVLNVKEM